MRNKIKIIEIWKDIPNYEGLYQINNFGDVKSITKRFRYGIINKEYFKATN